MFKSIRRCSLIALGLLALSSCGGETEEDRVRAVFEGLYRDLADGRLAAVCAAMTDTPKRQIGMVGHGRQPTTCERDLRELVASSREPLPLSIEPAKGGLGKRPVPRVVKVDIAPDGKRATVVATVGSGGFHIALASEDGRWKLADFFGATAPPPEALQ